MAIDTPDTLRDKLLKKMYGRHEAVIKAENYYEGNHPLAFAARKYRQSFGNQLSEFASNWCGLVIDVPTERLSVDGFRFGSQEANDKAWAIWKANNLHTESGIAHTEAAKHGCVYVLVEPTDGMPLITIEHPLHMIVQCSHENRRVQTAALRRWVDDERYVYATLYLPDAIYKWVSDNPVKNDNTKVKWLEREPVAINPLGVVPVVELQNKPGLLKGGTSDLRDIFPLNDGLNKLLCDLLVASEFYAFPQKIALGLEEAEDENGNPIPMEKVLTDLAELWILPDGADVKQLPASDLKSYSNAIQEFLQQLAALSRVPPNYLLGQMVNISGDALIAAEKGLTSKVKGKQNGFSTGWEDVMRLSFLAMGDEATAKVSAEVIWADAESRTLAQIADPIIKLRQVLGVPLEACWAMLPNVTPQMIEEWKNLAGLPDRAPSGGTFTMPDGPPAPTT